MEMGKVGNITYDNMQYSRYHDLRLYKDGQCPEHIDRNRTKNNIVFANSTLEEVYAELFDDAVEKYNEKQNRAERKRMGGGTGYLKELQNKLEMAEHKDKAVKPAFQLHIEVGDYYDTSYKNAPADAEEAEQILAGYFEGFAERNPHMRVAWAVMHCDESKPGIHATIVPWADGYKNGMPSRVSISRALAQQGFTDDKEKSGWEKWIESERETLENVMRSHGIEPVRKDDPKREKYTKAEVIAINRGIEKELHKMLNSKSAKIKKAKALLGIGVSEREYEKIYESYELERKRRIAAEELIKRTDGKEKDQLLEQLDMAYKSNTRYLDEIDKEQKRADDFENKFEEEKSKKEMLENEVKLLRSQGNDLTPTSLLGRRDGRDKGRG